MSGEIKASSNKITRRLPYRITYKRDQQQLEIGSTSLVAQGYEDAKMKLIAKGDGLRLEFGRKEKPQYSVTVSGHIENQGKSLKVQANWTEVPFSFFPDMSISSANILLKMFQSAMGQEKGRSLCCFISQ